MESINHFFNKSVVVRRLSAVSGYKKNFVATGTIDAHIQKISDEDAFAIYGVAGATHKAWCDVSENVKPGDQITDVDGNKYSVVATNEHDFGANTHLEIIMKLYDEEAN